MSEINENVNQPVEAVEIVKTEEKKENKFSTVRVDREVLALIEELSFEKESRNDTLKRVLSRAKNELK